MFIDINDTSYETLDSVQESDQMSEFGDGLIPHLDQLEVDEDKSFENQSYKYEMKVLMVKKEASIPFQITLILKLIVM